MSRPWRITTPNGGEITIGRNAAMDRARGGRNIYEFARNLMMMERRGWPIGVLIVPGFEPDWNDEFISSEIVPLCQ